MEKTLRGIGVSPGIAFGSAVVFGYDGYDVPYYPITDADAELVRLNCAIEATRADLSALYQQVSAELGQRHAAIFDAHLSLLDDVAVREELEQRIRALEANAEHILHDLSQRYEKTLGAVDDPRFRERTADLRDVVDRVMRHLLEAERPDLSDLTTPCIVVAHDLSPSDTATLNLEHVLALVTDMGSFTSHTAILARALEIPAVLGLEGISKRVEPGRLFVVDGNEGLVVVDPSEETLARYSQAREEQNARRSSLEQAVDSGPCRTRDGVEIPVGANVELPLEIPHSIRAAAQGIGLYRTEFLFLNRKTLPGEEEQYQSYSEAARALAPLPVTLRTMDIGGDKLASHLHAFREANPQLGWRAVRFCLAQPSIFKCQLRAMLRASAHGNIEIMFPMISGIEELRRVKEVLESVKDGLRAKQVPFNEGIRVGTMIEVPSAVMLADALAREVDFFSIGTNDLIQYSLAVDRVNEKIAHLYEPAHPAVLRMIHRVAEAAMAAGIPCHICGEMAGDPLFTEVLLGLGVNGFSMSAVALPFVRAEITQTSLQEAQDLAARALALTTASEIKNLLSKRYEEKAALDAYLQATKAPVTGPAAAD